MNKKLLIFDFDGTIADTLAVAVQIVNDVGSEFGIPRITTEEFMGLKHKNVSELMEMAGMSWVQLPLFVKRIRDHFKVHLDKVTPIEGMPEVLDVLHEQGFRMGILTSNTEDSVKVFLEKYEMHHFEFIHAPSSIFGKSSVIKDILKEHKLKRREVVMIGDEIRDVKAANKAKVDAIAVTWGFNTPDLLLQGTPRHLIAQPRELLEIFTNGNKK